MTITQNVASKLVVGFVAVSMLFSLSFAPVKAATAEELQAQINALLAQISSLQGGMGSSSCSASFTADLAMGASGASVTALQNFLISKGHTIAAGATGYFGAQTQSALAAYQSANGISPASGYFGPVTRAKVNASCTTSGGSTGGTTGGSTDSNDLSGEASLDKFEINDGEESDLEEGQEDAPVAEFKIEFTDGDALITRIDIAATATSPSSEEDAWDTFEEFSLWVDDEEVGRVSASDEDDYLDEDDGSLRFSNLDIVAEEDEEITVVLAASVQGSVDSIPATWNVTANAIRFTDGDGVTTTEDSFDELGATVNFDIDEEGGDDELVVRSSDEDPESSTLALKDDERSDFMSVFAFRLDTDDSTNDIEVDSLPIALTLSSSTYADRINDVRLEIDGETYDDFTVASSSVAYLVFDLDGDLVIEAGEEVTVEVFVEFKELASTSEGMTVRGSASSTHIVAEGADDLGSSQLSGSATGELHTLRTEGVDLEKVSTSVDEDENTTTSTTDNTGDFVIKFDVTAFETDVYVNKTAASGTTMGTAGANYIVEDSGGNQVASGTVSASLTSTADTDGTRFEVSEGETETFTLTVSFDPGVTGFYQLQLYSLNFATTNSDPTTQQRALPESVYQTDSVNVNH